MNTLFIGPYRDNTGWGHSALSYLECMADTYEFPLCARNIKLNDQNPTIPESVQRLEDNDYNDPDIVIQNILPEYMVKATDAINIGLFFKETIGWSNIELCRRQLGEMDYLWATNSIVYQECLRIKEEKYVRLVPPPVDIRKFQKSYKQISSPIIDGRFIFYTIGEFSTRKNYEALLRAFYHEFNYYDNVALLIKTHIPGVSPKEASTIIMEYCDNVRKKMGLPETEDCPVIVNTENMDENGIMRIHATGDCFVTTSRGEGWCLPAMDALGMDHPVINVDGTGSCTYYDNYKCDATNDYVYDVANIYDNNETWQNVNIKSLCDNMRKVLCLAPISSHAPGTYHKKIYQYSFESVGKIINNAVATINNHK